MKWSPLQHMKEWVEHLHELKTEHQYLGRYSIEKLCAFHEYQQKTSVFRVVAVIVFTPLPTILTLWGLDCLPLRDPRGGAKHHATSFLRSMLSHAVMTFMFLMAGKQALGLTDKNSNYTYRKAATIALCVSFTLEIYCVIWAFAWRFPTPFREFTGVTPWGMLTVAFNYLFAKKDLVRVVGRLKRYIPVVGTQLVLFYFLLFLSVGFAAVPLYGQIVMILVFPLIKLTIKRALWKYARNLDDISADVTICMVEISGSLYQTVCMQYVQNNVLALAIMAMDFVQAAFEARTYMHQDYMGDSQNTLQTAIKIVESALFTGTVEKSIESSSSGGDASARSLHSTSAAPSNTVKSVSAGPPKVRPVIKKAKSAQRDMSFEVDPVRESFKDILARLLRKGRSWTRKRRRRREQRYSASSANDESDDQTDKKPKHNIKRRGSGGKGRGKTKAKDKDKTTPRRKVTRRNSNESPKGMAHGGVNISREAATSVYINARVIRKEKDRRILDFGRVRTDQQNLANARLQSELPMAPPTKFIPSEPPTTNAPPTQRDTTGLTHRGSIGETNRGSTESQSQRGSISQPHRGSITDTQLVDVGEGLTARPIIRRKGSSNSQLLKRTSSRSVVPGLGRRSSQTGSTALSDALTPRTSRLATEPDEGLIGLRGIEMRGADGVAIDDIVIKRRDQARILEQTLQLLFSAEVLLFVEYMEVFLPLLMVLEVGTSLLYAMLELVSFTSVYFFIKKRYGISELYQLAFLLETYAMTLQGKLIGCFITLLNSSTLHQGIDITFKFDMDALLKTPNPYTT
ncbi:hypothetical protein PR001_g20045 [Phytophthora rubi]|uniref:Uncharacterized protein n=2 Tax=Phytophthora rubi TaxID=129364 RepID=A0A6A3JTI7_9STRA|nr:hypothetical protein PR001_g20045 [Phytophthora rubi]